MDDSRAFACLHGGGGVGCMRVAHMQKDIAMTKTYDATNIFARILRGEIPCKKILETPHSLAFHDISPQAPVHALVIPKGAYVDMDDFAARASADETRDFFQAIGQVAIETGLSAEGYRTISNCGVNGGQEVPHLHVHLLGGKKLGRMISDA